jgi:hypothetical protein
MEFYENATELFRKLKFLVVLKLVSESQKDRKLGLYTFF